MCGRFILTSPGKDIQDQFELQHEPELTPRYNIAPTQMVAVVRFDQETTAKQFEMLKWGLVPFWAKDASIGPRLINARCETLGQKPAYRAAFKSRRCLIPTNGFYEWMKEKEKKQPYLIRLADESLFAFAGLWEHWKGPDGSTIESCTVITTEANDLVRPIHDRMPVIIPRKDYDSWLNPEMLGQETFQSLLQPYPSSEMVFFPVNPKVNKATYENPDCIEPVLRAEPDTQSHSSID